jgi:hypothetical protein
MSEDDRFGRNQGLPEPMQGKWLGEDDDTETLVVDGSDVSYQGRPIPYDWFTVGTEDGALNVNFGVDDPARQDSFVRENLCGLVISPEGKFLGWNAKFGTSFVRVA